MIDLLAKQNEHLQTIVNLMKTDRLMQLAQTYGINKIDKEDDKAAETLGEISSDIKSSIKQENLHYAADHSIITDYRKEDDKSQEKLNKHNDDIAKKHLEALKNIQKGIEKNNGFRDIADKAKGEPVHTTFKEDWENLKDKFSSMKDKVKGVTVGGVLKGAKDSILASVSPRYADKLDYIRNEKNLDNKKTDKELEQDYDQRSKALQANKKNEEELVKRRGSLTEEEFLKGNKDWAPTYLENKAKIGETLKQTDSRYRLDDIKETPAMKEETQLDKSVNNIKGVVKEQADVITPMTSANITSEDKIETNRATELYQKSQLEHSETQNETLTEELDIQKEILDILKNKPVESAPVSTGAGIDLSGAGDVAAKAGGVLKKAGGVASKVLGAVAAPLAVGVAGAAIARGAAEVYSDSFGEGGFDVVKKLHDEKIIDYNATIAGFNPSEVLDWEKLQKVPPEDLKKLLDSGVEFSPEDTVKIKKIYEQSVITGGKDDGGKPATPEATKPEATKPEAVTPVAGGTVPPVPPATPQGFAGWEMDPKKTLHYTQDEVGHLVRDDTGKSPEEIKQADLEQTKIQQAEKTNLSESFKNHPTLGGEQVTPESQGYQEYTPKPEDSIATPTKPVITGNETEAELDAMNKSLGYTVEDVAKPHSQMTAEEIEDARDEREFANLENKASQLDKTGLTEGKFEAGELVKLEQPTKATPEVDLGDKGWINPQEETTPRPSIEQQLNNLDAQQVTPEQPTKANPLTVVPRTADSIYNQSAETVPSASPSTVPVINNISAPNNTVNNSTSKAPMKIDVKNPESSVNNMFAGRQRFS